MRFFRPLLLWWLLGPFTLGAVPTLSYRLSMPAPQTHYFEVEMVLSNLDTSVVELKMPVWTPGSYLIREYARHLEGFAADNGADAALAWQKTNKNTWRVDVGGQRVVRVRYRIYANDLTVRTSHLDDSHGYVNGASVFLYLNGHLNLPATLAVTPYPGWHTVSTSLQPSRREPFTYQVPDYDVLVDSPLEIGTHNAFSFRAAGVLHKVAIWGVPPATYDTARLQRDFSRIVEAATAVFGHNPVTPDYTFIVHVGNNLGGGLEHLRSTTCQTTPEAFDDPAKYRGFLGTVAHEYFHLWNVKRLRPAPLGPFDYDAENYTRQLWVAEGWTSYYDDYLLLRAGLIDEATFLTVVSNNIGSVESRPGRRVQSLAEGSFDAWIKYYRPDENSINTQVSYYTQGAVVANLLDLIIIDATDGRRTLDDVLRTMYERYFRQLNRGYTEAELLAAVSEAAGRDLTGFFDAYVYGTQVPDYDLYFQTVGLRTTDPRAGKRPPTLGVALTMVGEYAVVRTVYRDGPAWKQGLNTGDVVLMIGDVRIDSADLGNVLAAYPPGSEVAVTFGRYGEVQQRTFRLEADPNRSYKLEPVARPSKRQKRLLAGWLERGRR